MLKGLKVQVLDKGFVECIDFMGCDDDIVKAARISTGSSLKTKQEDEKLIHYLMEHEHTSPFEMCEIKFLIKCPIFIARQWMRHRTASINEYSARYSKLEDEYYVPDWLRGQSKVNHQCSEGKINTTHNMNQVIDKCFEEYYQLIDKGVSRELARIITPVSTYTTFYWKIDLHNLLKFLRLRMDEGAQYEIREYANTIWEMIEKWVPITANAFLIFNVHSIKLSELEVRVLKCYLKENKESFEKYLDLMNTQLKKNSKLKLLSLLN
jgi:thymidylate synthase (FAD)